MTSGVRNWLAHFTHSPDPIDLLVAHSVRLPTKSVIDDKCHRRGHDFCQPFELVPTSVAENRKISAGLPSAAHENNQVEKQSCFSNRIQVCEINDKRRNYDLS